MKWSNRWARGREDRAPARVQLVDYHQPADGEDMSPALARACATGAAEIQMPWGTTRFISRLTIEVPFHLLHANGRNAFVDQHDGSRWTMTDCAMTCKRPEDQ